MSHIPVEFSEQVVGIAVADKRHGGIEDSYSSVPALRELMREAVAQCSTPGDAAPWRRIVKSGMTVLLKPNWVLHYNKSGAGMACMVTHPSFIEAAVEEMRDAGAGRIIVADAPIQDCSLAAIASDAWIDHLRSRAVPVPLDVVDFRLSVRITGATTTLIERTPRHHGNHILFDLHRDSLLETISSPPGRFRNTNYNPDDLAKTHHPGRHCYMVCKEPFEADMVVNLPKLKAHRRAGITAALKNIVGINGDKNYLPHHRVGGSGGGGDCYEGRSLLLRIVERFLDMANRRVGRIGFLPLQLMGELCRLTSLCCTGHGDVEGAWHGNDTIWRMVLDLNRILRYGRIDGTLAETPQRHVFSLTDGIIAGQGEGPLAPLPLPLGMVTFGASSAFADLAHAALLRFDWRKIPLVSHAFDSFRYPIATQPPNALRVRLRGHDMTWDEVARDLGSNCIAPKGWRGHIEWHQG